VIAFEHDLNEAATRTTDVGVSARSTRSIGNVYQNLQSCKTRHIDLLGK